jgi:hypothetical protein
MSLKELNFKPAYSSDRDNILEDFYIPSLSNSFSYKRIAGYFSSSSLAVAAKGMSNFILNGGSMKLVCNVFLTQADESVIKEYLSNLQNEFVISLDFLEDELKKERSNAHDTHQQFEIDKKLKFLKDKFGV